MFGPLLVRYAVDTGIRAHDSRALALSVAGLVALGALEAASGAARHYYAMRNRGRSQASVRDAIFGRALALDARYHDRVSTGELMSRASNDADLVARLLDSMGHTIAYILTVLAVSVTLVILDAGLAVIVLAPLPLLAIGFWKYSGRYREKTTALQEELGAATTLVEETVAGIRVVKGLGAGPAISARFRRQSDRVVQRALDVAAVDAVFLPVLELLPLLGILAVLWIGGQRALDGEISIGTLVAFTLYVTMLVWPMRVIGQRVGTVQQAASAAGRVLEVLQSEPAVVERPDAAARQLEGHVRLEDVRFGYQDGRAVLDGLSLAIEPGTSLALVGGTGSGKSTVAALLARFYDVEGGRVTIDGADVRDLRLADLRRAVGLVFEQTFLFGDTVHANIAYGRPDASPGEVEQAARLAGAHDFIQRMPHDYGTVLGERGYSLSGGQRQRIAIARAILADPAVLILDDATSAVDATKEHEIRAALGAVMRGRTTLVIAHRAATIALADRVAVLEGGRIVEQGTHAELIAGSGRYRQLLALEDAA